MKTSARAAALEVLGRCRKDRAWSGMSLDSAIKQYELDWRDSALTTRLCLGVLQNSSYCDYIIDHFYHKSLEPVLRDILRLGVYQVLMMDKIPPHAAVSETVSLCRERGLDRAAGLVNAVLRRVVDAGDDLPAISDVGSGRYLATRYSHPLWLVERLLQERSYPFVEAFLRANNESAPLTIQIDRIKVSDEDYARALERAELPFRRFEGLPGCFELNGGRPTELPGFEEGLFYVQDRAARIAVAAADISSGMQVLDCCAAPGGKSFAAAIDARDQGSILSCDIHEKKLRLIRSGAERLGLTSIRTRAMDARDFDAELAERFDVVLADVPCSAIGVIRKRPEIRWKKEAEIDALPQIQSAILDNVCRYVAPGGVLLYSTCTVLRAEDEGQIACFLERNADFALEPFSVGEIDAPAGCRCFWPQTDGTDGFFVAKLRRKNA